MREIWTCKPLWGFWVSQMDPSAKRVGCCFLSLLLHELLASVAVQHRRGLQKTHAQSGHCCDNKITQRHRKDPSCLFPAAQKDLSGTWGVEKGTGDCSRGDLAKYLPVFLGRLEWEAWFGKITFFQGVWFSKSWNLSWGGKACIYSYILKWS